MTKMKDAKNENPMLQRYVFGLENGKPVGARFPQSEIKVFEVAKTRNLESHEAYNEEWTALAMQLPVGRVYARGKAFIPPIKRGLYDQLLGYIARCKEAHARSQAERNATTAAAREGKSGAEPQPDAAGMTPVASGFPRSWEEIAPGHLVLSSEPEGFWESIVVSRENDILTLRYRDYPKTPKFTRHVSTVGILNPGPTT
jgi:hypothetical protein